MVSLVLLGKDKMGKSWMQLVHLPPSTISLIQRLVCKVDLHWNMRTVNTLLHPFWWTQLQKKSLQSRHCENIINSYYFSQWNPETCHDTWFHAQVAWDSSSCQTAVEGSHGRSQYCPVQPSESCWCPLHQTPGATQLPGPHFCYLSPPIWRFFVFLSTQERLGFSIQITGICIVTIPLATVCCIWPNMPKWCQLLMITYTRDMQD